LVIKQSVKPSAGDTDVIFMTPYIIIRWWGWLYLNYIILWWHTWIPNMPVCTYVYIQCMSDSRSL